MTLEDSMVHTEAFGFGYLLTLLISLGSRPNVSPIVTVRVTSVAS